MTVSEGLLLFERFAPDGPLEQTYLVVDEEGPALLVAGERRPLPSGAIDTVMRRYGRPLAPDVVVTGPRLALGDGSSLARLRFRPVYDVVAKDYLVLERAGEPALCELGTSVAAALGHLADALARR